MPSAGVRGFLDASEYGTWLKHFQSTSVADSPNDPNAVADANVKNVLMAGQVRILTSLVAVFFIVSQKTGEKRKSLKYTVLNETHSCHSKEIESFGSFFH